MVDYARKEPETVREMFRKLYAKEHMDTDAKQQLMDDFIASTEELRKKYNPDSRLYVNNQRSVMMYFFLRYPNSNFAYKASQAKSFADCVEFYDDWRPMTNFKLDIFNHMCEQLIEEMKADEALMETHKSRFENTTRKLYVDENLHILLFDIIFSLQVYNFYDGMTYAPITVQARKLYFERVSKAREFSVTLEKAKSEMNILNEAKDYITSTIVDGLSVKHKKFGEGIIEECAGTVISVNFPSINETKKLGLAVAIGNGLLTLPSEEATNKIKEYTTVLNKEYQITTTLAKLEKEIESYLEYLD